MCNVCSAMVSTFQSVWRDLTVVLSWHCGGLLYNINGIESYQHRSENCNLMVWRWLMTTGSMKTELTWSEQTPSKLNLANNGPSLVTLVHCSEGNICTSQFHPADFCAVGTCTSVLKVGLKLSDGCFESLLLLKANTNAYRRLLELWH